MNYAIIRPSEIIERGQLQQQDIGCFDARKSGIFTSGIRLRITERRESPHLNIKILRMSWLKFGNEHVIGFLFGSPQCIDLVGGWIGGHEIGAVTIQHGLEWEIFPAIQLRTALCMQGEVRIFHERESRQAGWNTDMMF